VLLCDVVLCSEQCAVEQSEIHAYLIPCAFAFPFVLAALSEAPFVFALAVTDGSCSNTPTEKQMHKPSVECIKTGM